MNRFVDAAGKAGRTVVARLKPKTDLIGGLVDICKKNGISCGVILGGLGTLEHAVYFTAAPAPDTKAKVTYSDPIKVDGPIEFICGQGIIMKKVGDLFIHFHGIFLDLNRKIYGGHFNPGDNPILSTFDVIILEAEGIQAERKLDEELDLELMFPQSIVL